MIDTAYQERNATLRQLGYSSYREYLASPQWKAIRSRVMRKNKSGLCQVCKCDKATQVHHRDYSREVLIGRHTKNKLIPICETCHEVIERDGDRKFTLTQANARLDYIPNIKEKLPPELCHSCWKRPKNKKKRICAVCKKSKKALRKLREELGDFRSPCECCWLRPAVVSGYRCEECQRIDAKTTHEPGVVRNEPGKKALSNREKSFLGRMKKKRAKQKRKRKRASRGARTNHDKNEALDPNARQREPRTTGYAHSAQ